MWCCVQGAYCIILNCLVLYCADCGIYYTMPGSVVCCAFCVCRMYYVCVVRVAYTICVF